MQDNLDHDLTCDAICGGSVKLYQPKKGFRVGLDTILLAAAAEARAISMLELGAGAGGVSLIAASRLPDLPIKAVEIDPDMAGLLDRNINLNEKRHQITPICHDALDTAPPWAEQHDLVMINPPYHDASSTPSSSAQKAKAKSTENLAAWVDAAKTALAPKGRVVMITRADRFDDIVSALKPDFGDIAIKPIYARPAMDGDAQSKSNMASRILISARLGVNGGAAMLTPLILYKNAEGDALSPEMALIDQGKKDINMAIPGRDIGRCIIKSR